MDWAESLIKKLVWYKASPVPGLDPIEWRRDAFNNLIRYSDYGNRQSDYGWEIDHIDPNGGEHLGNFQPLHWLSNVRKGNRYICTLQTLQMMSQL
jgi:hypothetical protein